jgi:hypothetical protein
MKSSNSEAKKTHTIVGPGAREVQSCDEEAGTEPLGSEKQVFSIPQSEARAGDSVSIARYLHHYGQ